MRLALPLALLPLLACAGAAPEPAGWRPVAEAALSDGQRAQLDTALDAKDALGRSLLAELSTALAEGEPADAIRVCRERAPQIAREVGAARGLAIGRTSFRLRNPDNAPPAWARPLVDERVAEPRTLVSEDGRLAALLPIRLGPQCVLCHGPAETLDPGVRTALAAAYPDDRATGFAEGDLRGWFWVEVP